jgi:hypothetical protein
LLELVGLEGEGFVVLQQVFNLRRESLHSQAEGEKVCVDARLKTEEHLLLQQS